MAMTIRRTANRAATIELAFTHQRYLFGATPLERRIGRIRTLFNLPEHERPPANLGEELDQLESRYELFKIDFFNKYRWCVKANSIVAALLAVLLIVIAIKAEDVILDGYEWFAVMSIALAFLPAPILLFVLWFDSRSELAGLRNVARAIEKRAVEDPKGQSTE
jgi:hypothetical protein